MCLTNAGRKHAERALTILGLEGCFEYVFHCDQEDPDYLCKPDKRVYEIVQEFLGEQDGGRIHFFDDSWKNILKARELGWRCYLVNKECSTIRYLQGIQEGTVQGRRGL